MSFCGHSESRTLAWERRWRGDATGSFVYCFSLEKRVWSEVEYTGEFPALKQDSPYAGCRFGQSCVVEGGKAWIFGGCIKNGDGVEQRNDIYTFDLEDHCFAEIEVRGLDGSHGLFHSGPMF